MSSVSESGVAGDLTAVADNVVELIDVACRRIDQSFERRTARRQLLTALPEAGTHTAAAAGAAVVDLAANWNLRADLLSIAPQDVAGLFRPGAPLALLNDRENGEIEWLLISDYRGRKLAVSTSADPFHLEWLTVGKLAKRLDEMQAGTTWLSLQQMLPCEMDHGDHGQEPSPLSRFLHLLRPERSDIAVIVVFGIVVGLLTLSTPIAVEALVNTVAFGRFLQPVIVLAIILFTFLGFSAALRGLQTYIAEIVQQRLFVRVSSDLANRLPRVRNEFWDRHYGPELVNRFFEIVTVQKVVSQLLLDGLSLVLQTAVGMTVIAFYHPVLLGFDAFLLVIIACIVVVLGRGAVTTAAEESRRKYATAAWLEELARHHTSFRARHEFRFAVEVADRQITEYLKARRQHFRILMRQVVASLALQAVASTVLLGLGGWLVISGELTLGQLVAAELIVTVIVGSFAKVGKHLESYYDVMASMTKLGHLFDMPVQYADGVELPPRAGGIAIVARDMGVVAATSGKDAGADAFELRPGEHVAMIGGSSKQRGHLLEALAGLRPTAGHVDLDGYDLRRLRPDAVLGQVAVVRNAEIFSGTIAENLHVGRAEVSEERMRAALADVGLLDELLSLPEGLSTRLETDGAMLHRDQRARLMLARALAGKPRLLLIDGLLDGLPDLQQEQVLAGMFGSLSNCTCVIATGRQTVIDACQRSITLAPKSHAAPKRTASKH
jgi:putative ABC transport system ATP-binding protein